MILHPLAAAEWLIHSNAAIILVILGAILFISDVISSASDELADYCLYKNSLNPPPTTFFYRLPIVQAVIEVRRVVTNYTR